MKIKQLLEKYNLTENDISVLTTCMMEGKTLIQTSRMLSNKMSSEKVFAICKWYCENEFQIPIDEMAPAMVLERMEMQFSKRDEIIQKIEFNKEVKRLKGIEEDLRLLDAEIKLKIAV